MALLHRLVPGKGCGTRSGSPDTRELRCLASCSAVTLNFRPGPGLLVDCDWGKLYTTASLKCCVTRGSTGNEGDAAAASVAIQVKNLRLSLKGNKGEVAILNGCTISIPQGQWWMLLGPNGCGKSTLLKALAGLLKPSSGRFYVAGPKSFVFQNPDHQVVMPTAEVDVAFGLGQSRLPVNEVRERVRRSLQAVGMLEYAERPVQTLSGGQKQRIAIAGALAEESRVLLLDELTTFLDERDQVGVLEAVRQVVGGPRGVTALWVTHRLEELDYADGAVYMEKGTIVCSGSVKDVKSYIQDRQDEFYRIHGVPASPVGRT